MHQQQFVLDAPDFYPIVPSLSQLLGNRVPEAIRQLDSHIRAPCMIQSAMGIERQLPKKIVVSLNYLHSRGWRNLRSRNLAGPGLIAVYQYESSGIFKQSVNARISSKLSFNGSYTYGEANSDTGWRGELPCRFLQPPPRVRPCGL